MQDKAKQYEKEVRRHVINYLKNDLGKNPYKAFQRKKYKGKSGSVYEIDLSIEFKLGGLDILIAIECKNLSRRISREQVSSFATVLEEISASKGLMVTTIGFQSGALELATHKKIALATYCDFVYTPLIGDPEYYNNYNTNIVNYLSDVSSAIQNNFELNYGNAYRAEALLKLDDIRKENDLIKQGKAIERGFVLTGIHNEALVCPSDLLAILLNTD